MKKAITFLILITSAAFDSNGQDWVWAKSAGDCKPIRDYGEGEGWDISCDKKGNQYITGFYWDQRIVFGSDTLSSGNNMFISKYSASGEPLWARCAGMAPDNDTIYCYGYTVATDRRNNVFLTGIFNAPYIRIGSFTLQHDSGRYDEFFIAKYDELGNVLWAKKINGIFDDNFLPESATDKEGNLFITGTFAPSSILFDSLKLNAKTKSNGFLVKYDTNGNVKWAKEIGDFTLNQIYNYNSLGVATDNSDNILISGYFIDSIKLDSYTLHTHNEDFFLAKLDSSGIIKWARGSSIKNNYAVAGPVSTDSLNNIYITGQFDYSLSMDSITLNVMIQDTDMYSSSLFIAKFDSGGHALWAKSGEREFPYAIATNSTGDSYITGASSGLDSISFGSNSFPVPQDGVDPMFIARYDNQGNFMCASVLQSGGEDRNGVSIDKSGNGYVIGDYVNNPFSIGCLTLSHIDTIDEQVFIAKFNCDKVDCDKVNSINNSHLSNTPFNLFPNPASSTLNITTNDEQGIATITNLLGETIYDSKFTSVNFEIPVTDFSPGIYLLHLKTKDKDEVAKWIKD